VNVSFGVPVNYCRIVVIWQMCVPLQKYKCAFHGLLCWGTPKLRQYIRMSSALRIHRREKKAAIMSHIRTPTREILWRQRGCRVLIRTECCGKKKRWEETCDKMKAVVMITYGLKTQFACHSHQKLRYRTILFQVHTLVGKCLCPAGLCFGR
jgi:hypothetical protein